ncbi:MAG TPA: ubiquinol-cytochrome c reductase iron-sulfur subunit [Ktedonobacterales bacterium]|nr:ubiquinol-cytochrome c reductase iron-sulfur subunit [Ktedonobacterales bacterium]
MTIESPRTPQEYEVLTGGGAESAENTRRGISRRQLLRRATGLSLAVLGGSATYAALTMLYPNLAGQFGSVIQLKPKDSYPAALQGAFALDQKGVFYEQAAKTYVIHLAQGTKFLLSGQNLTDQMTAESWTVDKDGTYWVALYQVCVHLGCKYPFRDDCQSFKCPCHGSHYNVDGEYLDGPAPRSADRFSMSFDGSGNVLVDTGKLNQHVNRPDAATRILTVPNILCSAL